MGTQTHTNTAAEFVRTSVRLSTAIHRQLRIAAMDAGISVSALIAAALERALVASDPAALAAAADGDGSWVGVSLPAALHRQLRLAAIDGSVPASAIVAGAAALISL